ADDKLAAITDLCTFESMKRDAPTINRDDEDFLAGGARTFFFKGTNQRWRGVLDEPRLAQYEAVATKVMGPECKAWMETGGGDLGWGMPGA
ncbi:MAG: hypothetical protein OEZ19_08745, partial [Paracoccaceae bacterium]|nr:hypothetical protein [Paracoccaceae bacterium]